jgi:hypothetical protein
MAERRSLLSAAAGAICLLIATGLSGQTVTMLVRDSVTGSALSDAVVTLMGDNGSVTAQSTTDGSGEARLALRAPGPHRVEVLRVGYRLWSLAVEVKGDSAITVQLVASPLPLDRVEARAVARNADLEAVGFYGRQEGNRGHFIDREGIEARPSARRLSDLLRGVPGIRVLEARTGSASITMRGTDRISFEGVELCYPRILLDGIQVSAGGKEIALIDDYGIPSNLAGIEVYRSPSQLPPRFGGAESECGVVVIWTRTRS